MAKTVELFRNMASEVAREKMGMKPRHVARELTEKEEIEDARRLAVGKFANLGKIKKEEVDERGLLVFDPFLEKSTFFGAYDQQDKLEAVARLIWQGNIEVDGKVIDEGTTVDDMRLPVELIKPEYAEFLRSREPGKVAEIGSLAKRKGVPNVATLKLLREMFDFAQNNGVEDFVCGLEPKLYPTYKRMFGGALERMTDEDIEFPGIEGMQVPLVINVEKALSYDFENMDARTLGQKAVGLSIRYFFNSSQSRQQ